MYFERIYCNECAAVHWCETTRNNERIICHGYDFAPAETPTHYTRRLGRGIELIKKSKLWQPAAEHLPLDWQMAIEAHHQDIDF